MVDMCVIIVAEAKAAKLPHAIKLRLEANVCMLTIKSKTPFSIKLNFMEISFQPHS